MANNSIIIKRVTAFTSEIADAVKKLAPQIGKNYKELSDEDIKFMIQSSCNYLYLARYKDTGKLVGMFTLVIFRIPYVKKCLLEDLIVDEGSRRQGIGSFLLEEALKIAKKEGVSYIDFTSRPRRDTSRLYERLGFRKRESNVYRYILDYKEV